MKFATLADIHERLRLGADRVETLSKLKTKSDFLFCYDFFYPSKNKLSEHEIIKKIATDANVYFDVVKQMLPEKDIWFTLALESSTITSRSYEASGVLGGLNYKQMSFESIANRFDEKEARLLWRWLLKCQPVISKRTFFTALAKLKNIRPDLLKTNMSRHTIIKVFDNPESIQSLTFWWEHSYSIPTPMRWKAWTKLYPPENNTIAVILTDTPAYAWCGGYWFIDETGNMKRTNGRGYSGYTEGLLGIKSPVRILEEITSGGIIDSISSVKHNAKFSDRLPFVTAEWYDLSHHGAWDIVMQRLQDDDVQCVRLIDPSSTFIPDGIGGYVIHPNSSHVFLSLREIDDSHWVLGALDGLDEYVNVCTLKNNDLDTPEINDDLCVVVQVSASIVDENGKINQGDIIGVRKDLGIGNLTQYTELIERGMDDADR